MPGKSSPAAALGRLVQSARVTATRSILMGEGPMIPEDAQYTEEHEWVLAGEDSIVTVGITHYAQEALGDIVFVSLPRVGDAVEAGQSCGEVESTKSVSELYAPMTGEVVEVNAGVDDVPETINSDPYGEGWLFRIDCGDEAERNRQLEGLMSAREYEGLTGGA